MRRQRQSRVGETTALPSFPSVSHPGGGASFFSYFKQTPKLKEKQRLALVYHCRVLTGSARNEALLKGFYCGSSGAGGAQKEEGESWYSPLGRSMAGAQH